MTSACKRPLFAALVPIFLSLACGSGGGGTGLGPCKDRVASGNSPLIDDLTDGDGYILFTDGRQGGWYTYNDATGTQAPTPAPANMCVPQTFMPTNGQACTSGSGFSKWGAALGVSLNVNTDNCKSCNYDGSAHSGIRFTISGDTPTGTARFRVVTADTMGVLWGGTCTDDTVCTDAHSTIVPVTAQPQTVDVPWTEMKQMGWGAKTSFSLLQLFTLDWQVPYTSATSAIPFTLCVDNLSFY